MSMVLTRIASQGVADPDGAPLPKAGLRLRGGLSRAADAVPRQVCVPVGILTPDIG